MRTRLAEVPGFTTKDGSRIRELMHPATHGNHAQSLAEATVAPGAATVLHRHARSEEIYHVLEGEGTVTLGDATKRVQPGDSVCIPPGTPHRVRADARAPLRFLCACAPPYSHDDTELLE